MVEFHEHMLLFRLRRGLSQSDMARVAGISQGYLSSIEWGIRPVSKDVRQWFEERMDLHEYDKTLTDGEHFRIRVRRMGLNMGQASKHFNVSEATLLRWMRDEVDVPDWAA